MKKLIFLSLALLAFLACKNDPAPAKTENTAATPAAEPMNTPEEMAKMSASSTQKIASMRAVLKDVEDLPKEVKNKPEVQAIRQELGDIIGKAEIMSTELSQAAGAMAPSDAQVSNTQTTDAPDKNSKSLPPSDAASAPLKQAVSKDYMESLERYEKEVIDIKARLEAAKKKN